MREISAELSQRHRNRTSKGEGLELDYREKQDLSLLANDHAGGATQK
jgi:hypothetical protein